MKRYNNCLLIVFISMIMLFTSCSSSVVTSTTVPPSEDTSFDTSPIDVSMLSGSPGGVWDMVTNGIGACVNISYPGSIVQITPGSANANISRLINEEAEFALVFNTVAFAAESEDLRAVAALYPSFFQIVVSKELGVSTFEDIIANKIKVRLSIGAPGSNAEATFIKLLGAYDLTVDDLTAWGCDILLKGQSDSSAMLSDGVINGMTLFTLVPAPPVVETAVSKDLIILDFDSDSVETLKEMYGFSPCVIPAGTYGFQEKDVLTICDSSYLTTLANTDIETVYKITKAIHENLNYLVNVHASLKDITGETMPIGSVYPLHPGAEMYYREIGVID